MRHVLNFLVIAVLAVLPTLIILNISYDAYPVGFGSSGPVTQSDIENLADKLDEIIDLLDDIETNTDG